MIEVVKFLLGNICVRFGNKVYRQVVYNSHLIGKFNNTYRYLADIFSLNNQEFSQYTAEIYPKELTLNKSYLNGNNYPFLDLNISILNSTQKITTKGTVFRSLLLIFLFLYGDVPLAPYIMVFLFHNSFAFPVFIVPFFLILTNVIYVLLLNN